MEKERFKKILSSKNAHYALFLLIIAVFFVVGVKTANDFTSIIVNTVIVTVMAVFIFVGMGAVNKRNGLLTLLDCQQDFEQLKSKIEDLKDQYPGNVLEAFEQEKLIIVNPVVADAISTYFEDSRHLYRDDKMFHNCDISDYINEDLLHDAGNTSFSDFVSSSMTGLGILGTFVGLAIGLQSFHTETAEAMTNSIAPLIEGIKVAFYTSIFGVILSLVYGAVQRYRYNQAYNAMVEFLNVFYRYVGQHADTKAISELLYYQESQNDSLRQLAEDIGLVFSNAIDESVVPAFEELIQKMDGMVAAIGESFGDTINTSLVPAIVSLGEKMDAMADTIAKNQITALGDVVEKFLSAMNTVLHGQLENLAKTINALCEWSGKSSETMDSAINNIADHNVALSAIVENNLAVVNQLQGYVEQMDKVQVKSRELIDLSLQNAQSSAEDVVTLRGDLQKLTEQTVKIMNDGHQVIESIGENSKQLIEAIEEKSNEFIENIDGKTEELIEAIAEKSGELIASIGDKGGELIDSIGSKSEQLIDAVGDKSEQVITSIGDKSDVVLQSVTEQGRQVAEAVVEQEKMLTGLADEQIMILKSGSDYVKKQVEHLGSASASVAAGFDASATHMIHASEKLSVEMDTAMVRSFAQFDSQLAKALEHFGGTLHELQDIVENTPKAVGSAADKMAAATKNMVTETTKQQTELANTMRSTVQQTQAEANRVISGFNAGQNKLIEAVDMVTDEVNGKTQSLLDAAKNNQENMNAVVRQMLETVTAETKAFVSTVSEEQGNMTKSIVESTQKQQEMTETMSGVAEVLLQQAKQIQSLIDENERMLQMIQGQQRDANNDVNPRNNFRPGRGR